MTRGGRGPIAAVALLLAASADEANEIDRQLWSDMVTIPLFQTPTFIAYDSSYGNIRDNGTSDGPFYNAADWGRRAG